MSAPELSPCGLPSSRNGGDSDPQRPVRLVPYFLLLATLVLVSACLSGRHPAPVAERGSLPADRSNVTLAEIDAYRAEVESELLDNILPYWVDHSRDRDNGGFYSARTENLDAVQGTRGALMDARILWAFSAAYRRYPDPAYAEMAQWAVSDLYSRFWDDHEGGFYWSADSQGRIVDSRKILYVQSFVIYALSECAMAFDDERVLNNAIGLYKKIEEKCPDSVHGGYNEEFFRDWSLSGGRGRNSALGAMGPKSQNVHIHMLEAYVNLYRAWPDEGLKSRIEALQDLLENKVLDDSGSHLRLFFDDDWTPLGPQVSYGHDIEFSWLLVESAEVVGDPARLEKAREFAEKIAAATAAEGQSTEGGIYNEGRANGTVSNGSFDWWPQAEACTGFLNVWRFTGDARYFRQSLRTWNFIENHFVDRDGGEWFHHLNPDGSPEYRYYKSSFWKCPYHNTRACLEILARLDDARNSMTENK